MTIVNANNTDMSYSNFVQNPNALYIMQSLVATSRHFFTEENGLGNGSFTGFSSTREFQGDGRYGYWGYRLLWSDKFKICLSFTGMPTPFLKFNWRNLILQRTVVTKTEMRGWKKFPTSYENMSSLSAPITSTSSMVLKLRKCEGRWTSW